MKYTEEQVRAHAKEFLKQLDAGENRPCAAATRLTGVTLDCNECPYGGCWRTAEEIRSSIIEWLFEHTGSACEDAPKYIVRCPEGIPDWVQIGVKCKFSGRLGEHIGFLAGYCAYAPDCLHYLAENGAWYGFAEPISAEAGCPKDDEMVACWGVGLDGRYIVRPYKIGLLYAIGEWEHVTSYHGQLDSHIEALKDEVVYK